MKILIDSNDLKKNYIFGFGIDWNSCNGLIFQNRDEKYYPRNGFVELRVLIWKKAYCKSTIICVNSLNYWKGFFYGEWWMGTGDVWRVMGDVWRVTGDVWTGDVWRVMGDVWWVTCDVWRVMGDGWSVMGDVWCVMGDVWMVMFELVIA